MNLAKRGRGGLAASTKIKALHVRAIKHGVVLLNMLVLAKKTMLPLFCCYKAMIAEGFLQEV